MRRLRSWLAGLLDRRRVERDTADEMAFHLQARTEHWLSQGLPRDEAVRRARLEFGAVERYKEEARQARGLRLVDELRGDVIYGMRTLRAAPVFTVVSIAILAIAIGANTAVFSVVEAVNPTQVVEIVGVAADARFASVREAAPPTIYIPFRQNRQHMMTFVARMAGEPAGVVAAIRDAVAAIDANVPIRAVRTQVEQIDTAVRQERMFAYVASGFALLALLLASLGIYGTLAYGVARRSAEIGVRMTLGATRASVVAMFLRESLIPVFAGAAIGIGGALASTRLIGSLLFDVQPRDAGTIAATTLLLVRVALLAAWLPSRRASTVDPVTALRCD